jgi:transcriptional regulator with XRE-family HTH domain
MPSTNREPGTRVGDELGARLRTERGRLGLSLRELARRLDVSPSLVSQIENGRTNPSVRTLYAIVNELGVSFDSLFAPAEPSRAADSAKVQRAGSHSALDLESGVRWERLTAENDPDVDFLYATYEVGGASSPDGDLLRHSGREFGIVVRGQLGVRVGFEEHVLGPGDSISFDSSVPHRLHNDGDETVHAIWFVVGRNHPPGSDPRTEHAFQEVDNARIESLTSGR